MVEFNILIENRLDNDILAENYLELNKINLYLGNFYYRKNVSFKKIIKHLSYYFLFESLCMYGQYHKNSFLKTCNNGEYQSDCPISLIIQKIR